MKKRLIAALVLVTLVIGLCSTVMATEVTTGYQVGYAKVDINPYYTKEARNYLLNYFTETALQQVEAYWKNELGVERLVYGETIMPVSLQGNSHTEYRLAIGKQDDNGDGIVDANDGIFATCIAVTDPNKKTVFLMATDMINGELSITSQVRKKIYDEYGITGDRVMIDGSHSHHAPAFSPDSNVTNSSVVNRKGVPFPGDVNFRQAAYYMHQYWIAEVLPQKLFEAAKKSLEDRSAATMSKGTIEAEEANCANVNVMVGDSLNAIRKENSAEHPEIYGEKPELVTVLHGELPADVTVKGTNNNGEQYWIDKDGVNHVVVEALKDGLYYNGVRHDQSTTVEAMRKAAWLTSGTYYACSYPKAGDTRYYPEYVNLPTIYDTYIPCQWKIENGVYVRDYTEEELEALGYSLPATYATGNNFNGGKDAVTEAPSASTSRHVYILKETNDPEFKDVGEVLPRSYIDKYTVSSTYVTKENTADKVNGYPRLKQDVTINENVYEAGTQLYKFIDVVISMEDDAVTEVDDTLLVLKFDRDETKGKQDILLVNWRAHTNDNRKSSVDWKKEYTHVGFYDSFFQISSDWINAFRYALETQDYLVAYFSGASGNVNGYTPFGGWYEKWMVEVTENGKTTTEEWKATLVKDDDVGQTEEMLGGGTYTYKRDDVGKCKESLLGYDVSDVPATTGRVIKDASHFRNKGPIYGTELAEVALELLNSEQMQNINPGENDKGLRSIQSIYQTEGKSSSVEELLAAGKHHYEDVREDNTDNLGSTLTFDVFWWTDKDGQPIVDKTGACSMLKEDGTLAQKCVKGVPQVDANNNKIFYEEKDVTKLYNVTFVDGKIKKEEKVALHDEVTYTIASFYHANKALGTYGKTAGPAVELNAIMLCDEIALITANGELFDRYSDNVTWVSDNEVWADNGITWTTTDEKPDNKWETLWNATYGEPFFLGYCNDGNGYMPSKITYNYSTGVAGKSQGSYETQTGNYAEGTGEKVMEEFAWMLANIDKVNTTTAGLKKQQFYCAHCEVTTDWLPLSQVLEAHATGTGVNKRYHDLPLDGHYYVDSDQTLPSFTARYACLELNGKELKGQSRALSVGAGGVVSIQDSSTMKTGALVGCGFEGSNANGGTLTVPRGAILNLYSGTLKLAMEEDRALPENGGVLYVDGICNMYGGTIEGGQCHNAGGTIYSGDNSSLNLYGGTIETGRDYVGKDDIGIGTGCSRIRGKVLLSGNASVAELSIWPEGDVSGYYSKLTIKDEYIGTVKITFRDQGVKSMTWGKVIGISDNADISGAKINVTNFGSDEADVITIDGSQLKLGDSSMELVNTCQHCGEKKVWLPVSAAVTSDSAIVTGHYYADKNDLEILKTVENAEVCLDLYGNKLWGKENAFVVDKGGILSIQDSQEKGTLIGRGFNETSETGAAHGHGSGGGTVKINAGTFNLYSGILTQETTLKYNPGNGAVVDVFGTFNMYGGAIEGGTSGWIGGAVCVERDTGYFYMSGGKITGGSSTTFGTKTMCVAVRHSIVLSGDAEIQALCLYPNGSVAPIGELLTIEDTFEGEATLYFQGATPAEGLDIGTSNDADITKDAKLTVYGSTLAVFVDKEDNLILSEPKAALVILGGEEDDEIFASVEEAAAHCQIPGTKENLFKISHTVKLLADAETLSFDKTIVLDLNGYNVDKVIANGEGTIVYCMDSANTSVVDGTTVYDEDACGVVSETDGDVQGLPACVYEKDGKDKLVPSYLPLEEKNGGWTFHAVNLNVTKGFVRPSWRGMYFLAEFGGDDRIVKLVDTFGVAMSVKGVPDAESMWDTTIPTEMTNGSPYRFGDAKLTNVQNILSNVMKPGLSIIDNYNRSRTNLYVSAYLKTKDGEYIFGNVVKTSLRTLTEKISDQKIGPDGDISNLNGDQWDALKQMYTDYQTVMDKWNIPNLKNAISKNP